MVVRNGIIFIDTSTYDPAKAFRGTSETNSVHSLLATSFLLSKMVDLSMNQPVGFTWESLSIPAQSWHPKSHTNKKEILLDFPDSDRKLFLAKLLEEGSRLVLMVLAAMGDPSTLQPRHVPEAAGPLGTSVPPPRPMVPPWERHGNKSAKEVQKQLELAGSSTSPELLPR